MNWPEDLISWKARKWLGKLDGTVEPPQHHTTPPQLKFQQQGFFFFFLSQIRGRSPDGDSLALRALARYACVFARFARKKHNVPKKKRLKSGSSRTKKKPFLNRGSQTRKEVPSPISSSPISPKFYELFGYFGDCCFFLFFARLDNNLTINKEVCVFLCSQESRRRRGCVLLQ